MSTLAPKPRVKLSRLRDIAWTLWDPIGLLRRPGHPTRRWDEDSNLGFADEYDSYLTSAAAQLRDGTPMAEVVKWLMWIEAEHMGLGERPNARERAEAVVAAIQSDDSIWTWPDEHGRFT